MILKHAAGNFAFDLPEPAPKIRTPPEGWRPFDDWRELAGVIALDLETNDPGLAAKLGSSWARPGEGQVCGFSIAHESQSFYAGVGHDGGNVDVDKAWSWLRHHATKPDVTFVYANCIYDLGWLLREGIEPAAPPEDVAGMAALLDEGRPSYSLDSLLRDYLGRAKGTSGLFAKAKGMGIVNPYVNMHRMPAWIVDEYATADAVDTLELRHKLQPLLEAEDLMRVWALERECYLVGRDLRWRGVRVDLDEAARVKVDLEAARDAAIKEIHDLTGVHVSPNDNHSIGRALKAENPALVMEETSRGVPVVQAAQIEALQTPVSRAVRTMRKMDKAVGTFIEGYIDRFTGKDSRIHAEFHPLRKSFEDREGGGNAGAGPGRWSCVAPWTPIDTRKGRRPISDIKPGDMVWTHENRWRPVLKTWTKGHEKMLMFAFSNGHVLACTKKHRFMLHCGEWITAGELYERFKVLDYQGRECPVSTQHVPQSGLRDDAGDCGHAEDDGSERAGRTQGSSSDRTAQSACDASLFQVENGRLQPDEGEDWRSAPQLEGRDIRWVRVQDNQGRGGKSFCASEDDGGGVGLKETAILLRGPSYQRGRVRKQSGQFCTCDVEGSQDYSCSSETGAPAVQITAIGVVGSYEVHDITVAEDESYLACGVFSHNSSGPNLQNVPRRDADTGPAIRRCFLPEEGEEWLKADYSSQEPRMSTHFAYLARGWVDWRGWWHVPLKASDPREALPGAQEMVDKYNANPTMSFHKEVGKAMGLGTSGPLYDALKVNNLALIYGMSGRTFAINNGYATKWIKSYDGTREIEVAGDEAQALLDKHAIAVPWGKPLAALAKEAAELRGYTKTILGRRIRYRKRYADGNLMDVHKALNNSVQGSAADQMKSAQVLFRRAGINPLVVVHDDGNFSKPLGEAGERMKKQVAEIMADAIKLSVPSLAEMKVGKTWGDV